MKAMIFAAGVGSRLKEFTRDRPKCLMEVGGSTMLEHVILRLKEVGVTAIAINVHHHAEQVVHLVRSKGDFGLEVLFSHEPSLLDTGGGLKKVSSFFRDQDAFIIHNADILSTIDLGGLVERHRARHAVATLAVMERQSARGLYFDSNHHLIGWSGEKNPPPAGTLLGFSGVSVASHELFSHMTEEDTFSLIKTFLAAARASHRVWGEVVSGIEWTDIGTPEQLRSVQARYPTKQSTKGS